MPLALVRIDCRLIHGQVLETWVPHLRSNCILVADDHVARDPMQKTIMHMSVPRRIHVEIGTVDSLVLRLREDEWQGKRVLLLFSECESARKAYHLGLRYGILNVGNIHFSDGCHQVTPSVAFSPEDLACLRELEDLGVRVELRAVPNDRPIVLSQLDFLH